MYSNSFLIQLRSILRRVGVLGVIQSSPFYRLVNQGYESRFDQAMMTSLEPGMRIFDIGANVGYYTEKFADIVGPFGSVHAFEPVPAAASQIREIAATKTWIEVHQCAVADQPGEIVMEAETGSTSPTNKVAMGSLDSAELGLVVPVETIDSIAEKVGLPSAIKVDVEGYEWHVLQGGREILMSPQLRHVFVEIHFSLLEKRGLKNAAAEISSTLENAGFVVKFTDFSHIHAYRSS